MRLLEGKPTLAVGLDNRWAKHSSGGAVTAAPPITVMKSRRLMQVAI
jgi:hypothetical protein